MNETPFYYSFFVYGNCNMGILFNVNLGFVTIDE